MVDTKTQIKKTTGLEDTFSGYDGSKLEDKSTVEVIGSGNLGAVCDEYTKLLELNDFSLGNVKSSYSLSPIEINEFIKFSSDWSEHINYCEYTGCYTSSLIQNSYLKGDKIFLFYLQDIPELKYFANSLEGTTKDPIKIKVDGDLGNFCAMRCQNIELEVEGRVGNSFGVFSKDINVSIEKSVGIHFGFEAKNSTFFIGGDANDDFLNSSNRCRVEVGKCILDIDEGFGNDSKYLDAIIGGEIFFLGSKIFRNQLNSNIKIKQKEEFRKVSKEIIRSHRRINSMINFIDGLKGYSHNKLSYINENNKIKKSIWFR